MDGEFKFKFIGQCQSLSNVDNQNGEKLGQSLDRYMQENKKASLWIKNYTWVNKTNYQIDE